MRLRNLVTIVALTAALCGLSGCVQGPPSPTPTPALLTPPPPSTPAPSLDPLAVPDNRFGVLCGDLLSDGDFQSLYGAPLSPKLSNTFGGVWVEALIQDRAVVCRWGDGPYYDGSAESVSIIAAEGVESLEALASEHPTVPGFPLVPVSDVGDAAWVECRGEPDHATCSWSISVGSRWILLEFNSLAATEVDAESDGSSQAVLTPKLGSTSAGLASRIASVIASADEAPAAAQPQMLPGCATLFDWDGIAAELDLPVTSVESLDDLPTDSPLLEAAVSDQVGREAALRQSARNCMVRLSDDSSPTRTVYVFVRVVPGATWIGETGVWEGWGAQRCHSGEGGPICEFGTVIDSIGVHVRASQNAGEGVTSLVVEHFTP